MKSLDDAIQILIAQARRCDRLAVEGVPLGSAFGRVLAEDITSLIDVPAYDNSQMDGYVGVAVEMNNAPEPMEVS
jgi:molybdopterin molybdotransferase